MSDVERAEVTKDIELALVKKWRPYAAFLFSCIVVAVTSTWWVAHNIATTSDTDKIMVKVDRLVQKIDSMPKAYTTVEQAYSTHKGIHGRIDSLGGIVKLMQRGTVTSWRDKYGNTHFKTND